MNKIKVRKKILSIMLSIMMVIGLMPSMNLKAELLRESIAEWNWETYPTFPAMATGGENNTESVLTYSNAATNTVSTTTTVPSNGSIATNNWQGGGQYWLITVQKQGYSSLSLSFDTYSSGSGPKEFKVQISTTSSTEGFTDVSGGSYTNGTSHTEALTMTDFALPSIIDAADTVYIKLLNTDSITAEAGTSRLYRVKVTGEREVADGGETTVSNVTANPASGAVAVGTTVNLSTVTSGAIIQFKLNDADWTTGSIITLDEGAFSGTTSGAIIYAKATKDGLTDSDLSTFTYTELATIPIEQARTKASGSTVIIEGIVTRAIQSNAKGISNCTLYIQDDTAGIAIYKSGISLITYPIGTKVRVTGTLGISGGVLQVVPTTLTNIEVQPDTYAPRTPEIITIDMLNTKAYEGKLVKLVGVKLNAIATNSNHTIADEDTNTSTTMRCTEDSTLPSSQFSVNDRVDVIGIAANYNGTVQLVVSKVEDIAKSVPPLVERVTATPASGSSLPLGGIVSLSTITAGSSIIYTINGGAEQTINTNVGTVSISAFDQTGGTAVIKAKAVKGIDTASEKTFTYTQAKASGVQTSIPVGAVNAGSQVELTTKTMQAAIKYILTKKVGLPEQTIDSEATYAGPIILTEAMLPAKITAWAQAPNYLDSDKIDFNYKLETGGAKRNYFGQLHSHTAENSDGAGTLQEAYEYARDIAKLDFFAVTDHSNSFDTAPSGDKSGTYNLGSYNSDNVKWQNGQTAATNARRDNFASIYAYEMTWSGGPGHMNTFNTEGFVSRNNTELNNKTGDAGLKAYYELLKATPNSISQFNHPGETFGTFSNFGYYDPTIDQRISLLEVGNGEGAIRSGGYFPSYNEYNKALDKGWHVAPTNNQDNHKKGWGTSNTARTAIYTNDLSVDGLYQALRDMRVYSTEDNNLDIVYTLNSQVLGTILDTVPQSAVVNAVINDPDTSDKITSVSIISNGGKSIYTQEFSGQSATMNYTIPNPSSGYYYLKVIEEDGDIAVTAPIWLGKAPAVGITQIKCSTTMPVTSEPLTFSTEMFNNESAAVTLKSISYAVLNGGQIAAVTPDVTISSNGSYTHTQTFTPSSAGLSTVVATAIINVNGEDKTFTSEIELNVREADKLIYVGIDGSHFNEYVTGNYNASMGNFGLLAANYNVRTVQLNTKEELIAALANPKYKMMVFTAPSRRNGTTGRVPYAIYSEDEIAAIADFAKSGKTIIAAGWSDYYENYSNVKGDALDLHMAGQQNKLLKAIGSSLRISDDAALDDTKNGGTSPRLYLEDYNNFVSPLTTGIVTGQVYSCYAGSTIHAVADDGTPATTLPASVKPIISGHDTTYSKDSDSDGFGFTDKDTTIPKYNSKVLLTASETLNHANGMNSEVIVAGAAFMSNFEIQATVENAGTLNYSNYNILENIIARINPITITPIADVKKAAAGTEFTIEGTATSSVYNGTDDNKGFFDCIYIQDVTGGINLFPVSQGVEVGQKIRVTGTVSAYQGETQLLVTKKSVIDSSSNPVNPTEVSTADAMISANTGKLIKITGIVKDAVIDQGIIGQIIVDDGSGPALVYINGYITKSNNLSFIQKGAQISVTALASVGENYQSQTDFLPRMRVRDRGEIILVQAPNKPNKPSTPSTPSTSTPKDEVSEKDNLNTGKVQITIAQAATENKRISVKKDNIELKTSSQAILESLSQNGKKNAQGEVIVAVQKLEEKEVKTILAKALVNKGKKFVDLETGIFNVDISLTNKGIKTETIASVKEPMEFKVDLSKAAFKDTSKLTGVRYVANANGEIEVQMFGGQYDEKTKAFTFIANQVGNYSVLEADKLLQVNLWLNNPITTVNGKEITNDIAPIIINQRTMVPLRFIAENMNADVKWNGKAKKVIITMDGKTLEIEADKPLEGGFDGTAIVTNGRTLVPIRYVSDKLGANVIWSPNEKSVLIVK